ncbi:MAG TPA: AI-2E family transporter [Vicinamibacterales bacterium]|nr:AI-2E family transporter [Vicinamibacterales bacterium]
MHLRFRKPFLVGLVVAISVAFVFMVRSFLLTILMSAIFAGLAYPLYARLLRAFSGQRAVASGVTMLVLLAIVFGPLIMLLGLVVNEAIAVTEDIRPAVERLLNEPTYLEQVLQGLPGYQVIEPYKGEIVTRAGDLVNALGGFLVNSLSNTTRGTVSFVFHFFILLYTMFFLFVDGPAMRDAFLDHLPFSADEKEQMKDRFMSVTRAAVRGTLVIGVVQGTMAGFAFWVAGIPNVIFWTAIMVVLSALPLIGSALVWVPACIILVATGQVWTGWILAIYCAIVVGSVDNILRPRLVGKDTRMHDLVILFSTLGGIITFGPIGFIVGPVLAGLFVTSWSIFAMAYQDAPPAVVAEPPVPPPSPPGEPDVPGV